MEQEKECKMLILIIFPKIQIKWEKKAVNNSLKSLKQLWIFVRDWPKYLIGRKWWKYVHIYLKYLGLNNYF